MMAGQFVGPCRLAARHGTTSSNPISSSGEPTNFRFRSRFPRILTHVCGDASNYRFFTRSVRPNLRLIEIPSGAAADLGNEPAASCPIVLWIVGVAAWDLDGLLARLGLSRWRKPLPDHAKRAEPSPIPLIRYTAKCVSTVSRVP